MEERIEVERFLENLQEGQEEILEFIQNKIVQYFEIEVPPPPW
jgi:hypothetical protein